ncbi:aspartate--tRNA ligase [Candidatus Wolfebacteria bacterium]|nr:MAG: aspartate--tRNA ligase [Candidatus Wolfebacteria bacterium]
MKNRIYLNTLHDHIGEEITVAGWVDVRRDHGKLIFMDVRDMTEKVQMVALPNHVEAHELANTVRPEWVIEVTGIVNKRPEKMINEELHNGDIEIEITSIKVLNEADTPAFEISETTIGVNEEARMTNRYLDLRSERMQTNIKNRHRVMKFVRNFFDKEGFFEIETPLLTKSTPEGARDYVVPSRLEPGHFYALPQSPQQYKQLIMSSGFEKYFQFARCMRDEDTRGDRQPEFTQLDMEMSFVDRDQVMDINEKVLIALVKELYPEKTIQEIPFPRLTHKESMEKYGTDRPDLRKDKDDPNLLAFAWVTDFPFFEKTDDGSWTFTHNPFSIPKEEFIDDLLKGENIGDILTSQYDIALNGSEIGGGSIRAHKADILEKVFEILGHDKKKIKEAFGHMIDAFSSGTPPHGGIAWGFDRLMMILQNEPNIREVIAFPKTGEGKDLMMNSPAEIEDVHLKELGIQIKKN